MLKEIVFWGILFVVLTIAEISTVQLISVWLAISALITMFFALSGILFWQQVLVFVVISAFLLVATRPLVKKFMLSKTIPTNSESYNFV